MKAEQFDKIVKARTDERVDQKIKRFRESVYAACRTLFNYNDDAYQRESWHEEYRAVLVILSSIENTKGWPTKLWETQREKVVDELLSMFDEFTKARLAADKAEESENKMVVETKDDDDQHSKIVRRYKK